MSSVSAPASSRAFLGSIISTCSNPSVARIATFLACNSVVMFFLSLESSELAQLSHFILRNRRDNFHPIRLSPSEGLREMEGLLRFGAGRHRRLKRVHHCLHQHRLGRAQR